jgi:hypothetical protein
MIDASGDLASDESKGAEFSLPAVYIFLHDSTRGYILLYLTISYYILLYLYYIFT